MIVMSGDVRPAVVNGGRPEAGPDWADREGPGAVCRAIVVLMSAQGQAVPDITSLMQVSADCVRDVIHAFNERGSRHWTQNGVGAPEDDR